MVENNGRVLQAQEVTIHTAQVTIHTLRVGPKQVTMGMFRQIPYMKLLYWDALEARMRGNDTSLYVGTPWGSVNYWWDGDGSGNTQAGELLHVLWQCDPPILRQSRLFRCIVGYDVPYQVLDRLTNKGYEVPAIEEAWWEVRDELWCLPQLFIAV